MKTVLIGIARMGSTRLPGKVLKPLGMTPVLEWVTTAGECAPGVDEVWIATTTDPRDDVIEAWCKEAEVPCCRGSENDVLDRVYQTAMLAQADIIVRVTCDCPFLDPNVIGEVVALRRLTNADYATNNDPPSWPDGLDCEAFTLQALHEAQRDATRPSDRDTVTQFIVRNRERFTAVSLNCPMPGMTKERWVLDTEADYNFCQSVAKHIGMAPSYLEILKVLEEHPEYRKLNAEAVRNERFFDALVGEEPLPRPHGRSYQMLDLAREAIPLGTQTFSKSHLQYPSEAPLFVTHGNGGLVYDVDGNEYVDLVGGLLPNILGYRDPDVDYAIRNQLNAGISFSLATQLELQLARMLRSYIPCAEMARFGKSGTDVTTAAVRLARHVTGRNLILTQGYHGWADWSVCIDSVRNNGISRHSQETTELRFQQPGETSACVIIEPDNFSLDELRELRRRCDRTGTLLIFDEIITGFRWGPGGYQRYSGVLPDLACFGKAMGNGMPISALVGKRKYMEQMTDICFSGTFFGETLSLAAAMATIHKLDRESVHADLVAKNQQMMDHVRKIRWGSGIDFIYLEGTDGLQRIKFRPALDATAEDVKTLFMQEMIANGVLIIASHNFCFAHSETDMERVKNAYSRTFKTIRKGVQEGSIKALIKGPSIGASANLRDIA